MSQASSHFATLSVKQLQSECQDRALIKKGLKAELIARLVEFEAKALRLARAATSLSTAQSTSHQRSTPAAQAQSSSREAPPSSSSTTPEAPTPTTIPTGASTAQAGACHEPSGTRKSILEMLMDIKPKRRDQKYNMQINVMPPAIDDTIDGNDVDAVVSLGDHGFKSDIIITLRGSFATHENLANVRADVGTWMRVSQAKLHRVTIVLRGHADIDGEGTTKGFRFTLAKEKMSSPGYISGSSLMGLFSTLECDHFWWIVCTCFASNFMLDAQSSRGRHVFFGSSTAAESSGGSKLNNVALLNGYVASIFSAMVNVSWEMTEEGTISFSDMHGYVQKLYKLVAITETGETLAKCTMGGKWADNAMVGDLWLECEQQSTIRQAIKKNRPNSYSIEAAGNKLYQRLATDASRLVSDKIAESSKSCTTLVVHHSTKLYQGAAEDQFELPPLSPSSSSSLSSLSSSSWPLSSYPVDPSDVREVERSQESQRVLIKDVVTSTRKAAAMFAATADDIPDLATTTIGTTTAFEHTPQRNAKIKSSQRSDAVAKTPVQTPLKSPIRSTPGQPKLVCNDPSQWPFHTWEQMLAASNYKEGGLCRCGRKTLVLPKTAGADDEEDQNGDGGPQKAKVRKGPVDSERLVRYYGQQAMFAVRSDAKRCGYECYST